MMRAEYALLKPEDFTPIDIDEIKRDWEKINNVPNSRWKRIEEDLNIINNDKLPYTLRTFVLNNLSYCVVTIMMYQLKTY